MHGALGGGHDSLIYFGGYPGAVTLVKGHDGWARYLRLDLIEHKITREILLTKRLAKP